MQRQNMQAIMQKIRDSSQDPKIKEMVDGLMETLVGPDDHDSAQYPDIIEQIHGMEKEP